ncbi:outer-membrane lipoprotein carrier protein LolA [Streptomyces sp. J2-1]|uniref:LolA family protein n=1 Tax=Streptomyces corallincola TaxID=2851888 RepID=UPI001C38E6F6|nr:outer-membrane lipoprotein carrier protein LolA [Streptomyces corallincola]MBV2355055.1 outer-membrane lipoprotein carrier protein LolA [Streptomyces corallincola]
MAPYETDDTAGAPQGEQPRSRRRAARYVVPVAVVGVAAGTIGLVPALANSGDPDLPKISAQQLIEKMATSDVQELSGTVRISTDLGLPDLGGLADGMTSGAGRGGDGSSADPAQHLTELASGTHTLRVAADGPERQKLSLLEKGAEYSVIHNGKDVWGYDSKTNQVFHRADAHPGDRQRDESRGTPDDFAKEALKRVDSTTAVTVDGTAQVAGRDAYKLQIKPKQSGSTVGAITIAVDAKNYAPLKFTLTPSSGGAAVLDAGFTQVSFAKPSASTFDFTPPKGAKVTEGGQGDSGHHDSSGKGDGSARPDTSASGDDQFMNPAEGFTHGMKGGKVIGKGWNAVATFDTGSKNGLPSASASGDAGGFLNSLGQPVSGTFGKGTVYSTRIVNALVTDDGKVYVGAVTKDALVKTANTANTAG